MKYFSCILIFSLVSFPVATEDYQVTVSSVDVWVKAVDGDGKPVTGLTQDDFEIFEDGKRMAMTCFEEQMIAGSKAPIQTTKPVQVVSKKFVLFLDLFNTSVRQYGSIKPHLLEFVNSISNGSHEVMLVALMPNGKLGVVAPFTKDLVRIRILLNKAQAGTDREVAVQKNLNEINGVIADEGGTGRGSVDLIDKIRDAFQLARSYARQEQQLSEYTLQAVEKFAQHMAIQNLGDNSVVVYVSGGFSVDPGRQYYDIVTNLASTAGTNEEFMALSQLQERNMDMRSQIKNTLGKLNRMNVTFYTIDTEGLGGASEYQDSLVEMASETGGTSFYNSQNFKLGLNQVIDDLNHQYLLCFSAPVHSKKGQYHSIKVTSRRPGVDLRHRRGYTD
ncbi:VWA domain-containing protein [bacterium]|nr:VWA domain-containing protein [bacterium]MCI0603051.1 VWA domain-containing protein [bacterium]